MIAAPSARPRARGFTLIEVMAALIIISLGMLAAIQAVTQTLNTASYLRDKTIASWVALNKIEEVRLGNAVPTADSSDGTTSMAGRDWRWHMAITATSIPSMLRIDVRVAPAELSDKDASIATAIGFYGRAMTFNNQTSNWDPSALPTDGSSTSSTSSGATP